MTSAAHAADRLLDAVDRKGSPVCVGIDPVIERLPKCLLPGPNAEDDAAAEAIGVFVEGVLRAVEPHVPCVKFQSACFERFGHHGVAVLESMMGLARSLDLQVILDAKRGDIGVTAEHYAHAAFGCAERAADFLTINSYLGEDAMRAFLRPGSGAFALVRTSNPGGDALQTLKLADGRTIADAVGELVATIGRESVGDRGYSSLGAVVGATKKHDAARLRALMPQQIFLVPGYGAQGAGAEDIMPCFDANRSGAIVAASRSVIFAFEAGSADWAQEIGRAAAGFASDVAAAIRTI